MFFLWIDPFSVSDPDFLGLADHCPGFGLKKGGLAGKFIRFPGIIGVQQRNKAASAFLNPKVPGRTHPFVFLDQDPDFISISSQQVPGSVCRPVIHHNDFPVRIVLGKG